MFGLRKMTTVTLLLGVLILHTALPTHGFRLYDVFKSRPIRPARDQQMGGTSGYTMPGATKQDLDFYRLISHLDNVGRR